MTKECMRMRKFLMDLDQLMLDNEYWDEEKKDVVCTITESDCYEKIMKTEEYHLLTTVKVKAIIHLFFSDYSSRRIMLSTFKAF